MSSAAQLEIEVQACVKEINAAAISRSTRALKIMRNVALKVLGQDGSGRVYPNGHVASAKGEPPAPDTGSLRDNWQELKTIGSNGGGVRIFLRLRSMMEYASYLDPGTKYIAKRPYVEPIKEKSEPKIAALFASI